MPYVALVYDVLGPDEKALYAELRRVGAPVVLLNVSSSPLPPRAQIEAAIIRPRNHLKALHAAAAMWSERCLTVNPWYALACATDRVLMYSVLRRYSVPVPKTLIALAPESMLRAVEELGLPAIDRSPLKGWERLDSCIYDRETARIVAEHRSLMRVPALQHHVIQVCPRGDLVEYECLYAFGEVLACTKRPAPGCCRGCAHPVECSPEPARQEPEVEELVHRSAEALQGVLLTTRVWRSELEGCVVVDVDAMPELVEFAKHSGVNVVRTVVGRVLESVRK